MRMLIEKVCGAALFCSALSAHGQVAQLSPSEIEKRNAAATFVSIREASLFVLVGECGHLTANSDAGMEGVARGWLDRNKSEIEATRVWLDKYLSYLKSSNPEAYRQASAELTRAVANSVLHNTRVSFSRKQPDMASCEKAGKLFSVPQLDFKNIALNPGFEQFAEFPETLARIRASADFSIPPHLKFGMDQAAQNIVGVGNMASLDAAEAAKERGDGLERIAILKSMAERGDGVAAQTIALIYLNGQQVEKSPINAYRWFYAAWSLSEMDGLNVLGVMHRDGLGVPVNLQLAAATFYLAKAAARSREAFDRASGNLDKLTSRINAADRSRIACMTLLSLDDALRMPISQHEPLVKGRSISNSSRRLGAIVKDLADAYIPTACN